MKLKKLGNSNLELSRLGLGTWAIGGGGWKFGWGPQDDEKSIRTIHTALDCGINWIDTAAIYGLGHSEEVVGKTVKGMSEPPYIFTKCSRTWGADGQIIPNLRADNIARECEASLKRLQIEVIDLYQIHWPQPEEDIEEGWEAVNRLIREGKVRYGGVSNFNRKQLERIGKLHPVTSLQPPYSMIVPETEEEILPYCGDNSIGVICYSPMYKGLLTGKFTRERLSNLASDDHRNFDPHFREPELSANLEFVEGLKKIALQENRSMTDLALAWVLRRPEVTAAIVGARRPEQIRETTAVGDYELSEQVVKEIGKLLKKRNKALS